MRSKCWWGATAGHCSGGTVAFPGAPSDGYALRTVPERDLRTSSVPRRAPAAPPGAADGQRRLRNPANWNRAVPLTYEQFRYNFAIVVGEDEAKELHLGYSVAGAGEPLF